MPLMDIAGEETLVRDYQRVASEIFPLILKADNSFLRDQYAIAFANVLGNQGEFYQYLTGPQGERLLNVDKLLASFKSNVSLIVQKTWVETAETEAREAVLADMDSLAAAFSGASYDKALERFLSMERKLAALIFGSLSEQDDFVEYAFRIEPKFGLFVWFVGEIEREWKAAGKGTDAAGGTRADITRLELLIGMYFLSVL
jgi:hypothetical protein